MLNYSKFKNVAFKFDPEFMHDLTFELFHRFPKMMCSFFPGVLFDEDEEASTKYQMTDNNLKWNFPVGSAAGLDKNAHALTYLSLLGFGAIEVGTVTPKEQEGNEKPRIFRYPREEALRNSMGFPNKGVSSIIKKIEKFRMEEVTPKSSIGVNIGANKENVQKDQFFEDLRTLYSSFATISDYLVINISSPNTANLRTYQSLDGVKNIFESLSDLREKTPVPLFIKIAPDMEKEEVRGIVELTKKYNLSGLVATNTTIDPSKGKGGVSGRPLYNKSKEIRDFILDMIHESSETTLIGVGGFFDFNEMIHFWSNGGRFLQIYTSFIYKGPTVLLDIQKGIDDLLRKSQASSFQEFLDGEPRGWAPKYQK